MPISYAALAASHHRYVLTLHWGGATIRMSTSQIVIPSDDGDLQVYGGLDDLSWVEGLDLLSTEAPDEAISLEIVLPEIEAADLIARGHDLAAATAEIARWVPGTTWEGRQILLLARLSEPEYGGPGEPIACTLVAEPYTDRTSTHLPSWRIGPSTFSEVDLPERSRGRPYPIVFGAPGWLPDTQERVAGSPALVISRFEGGGGGDPDIQPSVLLAGHRARAGLVSVGRVVDGEDITWVVVSGEDDTDKLGQDITTAQLTSAWDEEEVWASWSQGSGGLLNRRQPGPIRTAGELLDYLLDRTQLRVDQGRLDAAIPQLDAFRVSGYIDSPCNVWHWIRDNLLPILPVSIRRGPEGLYPVVWRYTATAEDAVEHLSADRLEVHRAARVRYTDVAEVYNEISLQWGLDARLRSYTRTTTMDGQPGGQASTHALRVSYERYGRRVRDVQSTDIVYEASTAAAIVSWLAAYHALPARMLEYVGAAELWHLEVGDVVTITDSEVRLHRQVCIVTELRDAGDGMVGLVLRTIEDPSRVG